MSLQLVTSHDHALIDNFIMTNIKQELKANPLGNPIFYIVPEQMTFQQEYALFKDDEVQGSIRAQVVSFSRLAWRMMQEVGGSTKQFISSTGTQMMLRKIIDKRTEPFQIFQKATDKMGFLQELDKLITEFKRHQITPDLLEEQLQFTTENQTLQHKLADLHYIYKHLNQLLKDKYIDGEDQLQMLIDSIKDAAILKDAHIYIDGFYRFTPQELSIVGELLKVASKVTIALIVPKEELQSEIDELDLFYQTKETYHTLKNLANEQKITINEPVFLKEKAHKKEAFIHLQHHFDKRPAPASPCSVDGHLQLAEAVHPRAEIEGVIQEILRLVREENYRYRDIVIFVRETEEYYDLIQTLFNDFNIPVFVDEKRTMLNHPFIEFLRSLFDVIESNWRYDAVFRLLKTGFIRPTDKEYPLNEDAIDQLENYVLEFGIRHKNQWLKKDDWKYFRFRGFVEAVQTDTEKNMEQKINRYRRQFTSILAPFDKQLKKCRTVREFTETIYLFLEQLNIPNQLEEKRINYENTNQLEKAREEEQVWQEVIHLFDELVEMIGEDSIKLRDYISIVSAGIEALQFSHVPPSMDHVIVGTIDQSRITNKKCVFLIGVNEGSWPIKPKIDGMINEAEREFLEHFGLRLAASNRRVLLDDQFYMYLAFTMASDFLWVSYVLSDREGKAKTRSQMIYRLKEFFPNIKEPLLLTDPEELDKADRYVTTALKTRGPLTVQLSRYLRGYPIEKIWFSVFDWYVEKESKYSPTYRALQSLFYENKPTNLTEETVEKLIPKHLNVSVSRMEMYYQCSYRHFLNYHLNLDERRTYSLEAPDVGQLFHEALKVIAKWVQNEGKDFKDLTKTESELYAEKSIDYLTPVLQHHVLLSSNRHRYITKKLQQVIAQATYILSEQARVSGFSPVGIELGFGYEEDLAPVRIPLPNNRELILRGRIDRVDKAHFDNQLYLRIIDYKSSEQNLSLEEVYYGIALQMLTYLHVVLLHSKTWLNMQASPAGVLYFHVHDAMVDNTRDFTDEQIERLLFKEYKMKGLILDDPDIAVLMDENASEGNSDIIPAGLKKDGNFNAYSKVASESEFTQLRHYVQAIIKQAGLNIFNGEVKLNPYENSKGNACRFCPFKSVCQFDPILRENNYRRLKPLKNDEVMKKIKKLQLD